MVRLRRRSGSCRALSALCLSLSVFLPGCRKEPAAPISQQKFVDTYVQLVQARIDAAGDSVAYAAKRDRVFIDAGVKPEDLRAFIRSGRDDPMPLRDAWQAVAARLDTLYGGVTSRPPPGLRDALRTRGDTSSVNPRVIGPGTPSNRPRASAAPADSAGVRGVPARVTGFDSSRVDRPPSGPRPDAVARPADSIRVRRRTDRAPEAIPPPDTTWRTRVGPAAPDSS